MSKVMPGSIPAPNSGSIMEKIRKMLVAKWGKPTKKKHFKKDCAVSIPLKLFFSFHILNIVLTANRQIGTVNFSEEFNENSRRYFLFFLL
jgi:hypothetical protein